MRSAQKAVFYHCSKYTSRHVNKTLHNLPQYYDPPSVQGLSILTICCGRHPTFQLRIADPFEAHLKCLPDVVYHLAHTSNQKFHSSSRSPLKAATVLLSLHPCDRIACLQRLPDLFFILSISLKEILCTHEFCQQLQHRHFW